MSVIIDTTKSELKELIRHARIGANNCMIANSWEITDLVRCRDCAKNGTGDCAMSRWWYADNEPYWRENWNKENDYCSRGEMREEIKQSLKAEKPARRKSHGYWIRNADPDYMGGGYVWCSHCGYGFSYGGYQCAEEEFLYCPHCGAKMVNTEE